jgi:uncharacterized membrane protein
MTSSPTVLQHGDDETPHIVRALASSFGFALGLTAFVVIALAVSGSIVPLLPMAALAVLIGVLLTVAGFGADRQPAPSQKVAWTDDKAVARDIERRVESGFKRINLL